jgi:thiol-disulfide isomerase/thioredoxin
VSGIGVETKSSLTRRRPDVAAALFLVVLCLGPSVAFAASSPDPLAALLIQPFPDPLPAPVVSLKSLDGRPLRLEDLRGQVVFLNFWATWCVPCRQEMPAMERLYRDYRGRGFAIVAVNYGESQAEIQRFAVELSLSFPMGMDAGGAGARAFAVRGLPVTYLLERDGRILWRALGSREWDGPAGRAYFDKLLRAPQP